MLRKCSASARVHGRTPGCEARMVGDCCGTKRQPRPRTCRGDMHTSARAWTETLVFNLSNAGCSLASHQNNGPSAQRTKSLFHFEQLVGNGGLLHQTANHWRFGVANHQSCSDQLLAGMADRTALVVRGARPCQFGGLGSRPCFLAVCLPKPPPTIWIAAVCYGKPPKFAGCCTKQPKRHPLLTVLPPKPQTAPATREGEGSKKLPHSMPPCSSS